MNEDRTCRRETVVTNVLRNWGSYRDKEVGERKRPKLRMGWEDKVRAIASVLGK